MGTRLQELQASCDLIVGIARDRVSPELRDDVEYGVALTLAAPSLLASLREYALPYTDDELQQLSITTSGRGEISPDIAQREIRRRAAIAKTGCAHT